MNFIFMFTNFIFTILSRIWFLLFNHLINVPLTLILGVGKYFAFVLAVIINQIQIFFYYKVLEDTKLGTKFKWLINRKIKLNSEKVFKLSTEKHFSKYFTISILALLPIYFGGIFFAVFYAHSLKVEKVKSYIFLSIGSLLGCAFWTIGLVNIGTYIGRIFKIW